MIPVHGFTVVPRIPDQLQGLFRIAMNLWWCWDPEAIDVFRHLDRMLWERCYANPIRMLGLVSQERLAELATDEGYLAMLDRVGVRLSHYLERPTWFAQAHGKSGLQVAYFCAEFGIVEGVRLYSGGLGILAGDHLKSASDLGIPLTAVGLLYRRGYFRQYLNADGWQQEQYPEADFHALPLSLERGPDGNPLIVSVEFPGRTVQAQVWRAQVGRVPLYLMDTDVDANRPEDRVVTSALYDGDKDLRIRQEIVLGVGGLRALKMLGIQPTVCHMNEGHAAFLAAERIRQVMEQFGVRFAEAKEVVAASNVFTTHTPVPAGIDVFPPDLVDRYFGPTYAQLGLTREAFLALGRQNPADGNEPFSMAVLAIRLSGATNGVSALHARVSRRMWSGLWPDVPVNDLPITSITNGVHVRGWLSQDMAGLFDAYLGPRWVSHPADQSVWERVEQIPDAELWRTHERRRERLVGVRPAAAPHAARAARRPPGRAGAGRGGPGSQGPDHRLRPALRDLQARHPALQGSRPGSDGSCPIRSGRCRSSSPGRPIPPTTRARTSSGRWSTSPGNPSSASGSSSWKTTTSRWAGTCIRAWTCG